MNLNQFINSSFPHIQIGDQISKVYKKLEKYETLPITHQGKYLGVVTLDEFSQITKNDQDEFTLENARLFRPHISSSSSPLEATKLLLNIPLEFLPVVDNENLLMGVWDNTSIIDYYLDSEALKAEGASILLEIEPRNYSLSEISQICENNDKRILGVELHTHSRNETLIVTIHLDEYSVGDLISALERYGYNIITTIGYQNNNEKIKENYDVLMTYLDM